MKNGFLISILLVMVQCGHAQGFVNLDFEDATVAPTPANGFGGTVDPAIAFPGWTVAGNYLSVLYNNLTLGGPAVILMGPNFPNGLGYAPLQGSYSVLLYYDNPSIVAPPTISQTGLVPSNAQSINFLVNSGINEAALTLNGVNVPLASAAGGRMAGDVSAFAGSIATLTFSVSLNKVGDSGVYFDDIQFSSQSVPEPSEFALGVLCALLIGFRRWKS